MSKVVWGFGYPNTNIGSTSLIGFYTYQNETFDSIIKKPNVNGIVKMISPLGIMPWGDTVTDTNNAAHVLMLQLNWTITSNPETLGTYATQIAFVVLDSKSEGNVFWVRKMTNGTIHQWYKYTGTKA